MRHRILVSLLLWQPLIVSALAAPSDKSKAKDFQINCCKVSNPPSWLTAHELNRAANDVADQLHWVIRRVLVKFHDDDASFAKAANLNFRANAFFSPRRQEIHVAPPKDKDSFFATFRHELVHVIFNQKFKGAIPSWLEEGFANYLGSKRIVNYEWLAQQKRLPATNLTHPNNDAGGSAMHYQLSTASAEMLANKCNLKDLFMLATGSKLERYLATYCKIPDVNKAVDEWITNKAKAQ